MTDAADAHAIKTLLVTDEFIHKHREEGTYTAIDKIMKDVDSSTGDVYVISTEHDAGKKLDGIGGIAAVLRFRLK